MDGPILGIDFLRHFGLIVDPLVACVRCRDGTVFRGSLSSSLSNVVLSALLSDIQPMVASFPEVCSSSQRMPPPAVGVEHSLLTEGPQ